MPYLCIIIVCQFQHASRLLLISFFETSYDHPTYFSHCLSSSAIDLMFTHLNSNHAHNILPPGSSSDYNSNPVSLFEIIHLDNFPKGGSWIMEKNKFYIYGEIFYFSLYTLWISLTNSKADFSWNALRIIW